MLRKLLLLIVIANALMWPVVSSATMPNPDIHAWPDKTQPVALGTDFEPQNFAYAWVTPAPAQGGNMFEVKFRCENGSFYKANTYNAIVQFKAGDEVLKTVSIPCDIRERKARMFSGGNVLNGSSMFIDLSGVIDRVTSVAMTGLRGAAITLPVDPHNNPGTGRLF